METQYDPNSLSFKVYKEELEKKSERGGIWIFIVAGLTFIFGIVKGVMLVGDLPPMAELLEPEHDVVLEKLVTFVILIVFSIIYFVMGYHAHKGKKWAFIAALIIYSLDSLAVVLSFNIFGLLIRGFVLYMIGIGLHNLLKLEKLNAATRKSALEDHLLSDH